MQFDWQQPYPTLRTPIFARNVVSTSQPLAAQAGLRILAAGGNAVEAAIATAAAMTIVEPISNGLGSDCFAIIWDGQQLHGLNASGMAPSAWDLQYFERHHGGKIPQRGWGAVTVPGAVGGWAALHDRFGTLPFEDLLAPAIALAERGYGITPFVHRKWGPQADILQSQPGFAQTFLPKGRPPAIGERFSMPAAAATLRRIAKTKGKDFYLGETAESIVRFAREHGGAMTAQDLAAYRPDWVGTISQDYHGVTLHEIPPNGQGIAALMALGILSEFDLTESNVDSIRTQHLLIEAMKAAFSEVYQHVADPRYMTKVTPADLLDKGRLRDLAKRIKPNQATNFEHGLPPPGGTIYLTAADRNGMMVSFIQSNYMGFGSGVVVPDVGVSLQNRGHGFLVDPKHPNCVAPGKRPFHTIIPAFLMRDGKPQMSFGVMGGNMQPQGHLQTLVRMIDFHQNPQAACDAPRWKVNRGLALDVETTMQPDLIEALRDYGHAIMPQPDPYMDFGAGQFIWRLSDDLEDGYIAASDSRRDGAAVGF
jgi:gamma-glutamyltranspeptidase/glutathione hydrolase